MLVFDSNHGALGNVDVLEQGVFDFSRRHPNSAGAQPVIVASYVEVISVLVLIQLISGQDPALPHRGGSFLGLVPILLGRRRDDGDNIDRKSVVRGKRVSVRVYL